MKPAPLVPLFVMAVLSLLGCGGGTAAPSKPFDLAGGWIYLGPSDGPHDLTVSQRSMIYMAVDGTWSSTWTIETYDDDAHHFQVAFDSGSGTYLPVGQKMSGTYDLSGSLLTVQLAGGVASYPSLQSAGTCTSPTDGTPIPECRLYIKQN